ncbi:MAG: DUF1570 domain-containing protein [Polyangiaceae bacterium]
MLWKPLAVWGILGATPLYDLPTDVAARGEEARQELGKGTSVRTVEGVFVLAAPGAQGSLPGLTQRVLQAYFNGRFERRPQRAISVYLFPSAQPYEAYCKKRWNAPCGTPFGFYRRDERRIVMNAGPGIGTLTHELVHPIVEADFPEAPEWLNEGIASLFEALSMPAEGQVHGVKNWRHPALLEALRTPTRRARASLPALFALSDTEFRNEDESLHYATARYVCQWLDQKGQLWPFYQRFRDHHADDPTGQVSFEAVTGLTLEQANQEWLRWVTRL